MSWIMTDQLYFLSTSQQDISVKPNDGATLTIIPSFDLAHKQLAHPGKDALQQMIWRKLVMGLDGIPDKSKDFDCVVCICGKMTRVPFQKGHNAAEIHLGHLHLDVCGPMETLSLGKRHYFCILVDDKTGYCWFHTCSLKSDFTPWFTQLNKLFHNHYGTHTKIL